MSDEVGSVVVVILHFGRAEDTRAAVASVRASTIPVRVVVVNNGPAGALDALVAAWDERVEVVQAPGNLGFATGVNLGLRWASGRGAEYVFLLNNDATVEPATLAQLVGVARADPQWGILAPVVAYAAEPSRVWSAGWRRDRWTGWLREVSLTETDATRGVVEVDVVAGCAMLLTRTTLDRVGPFDEGYFMYYEDGDYCFRTRRAGWGVGVVVGARAYHQVSPRPRLADPARVEAWARSKARFYTRLAGRAGRAWVLPRLGAGVLAYSWRCLLRRDPASLARYLRATVDGWRSAWDEGTAWNG